MWLCRTGFFVLICSGFLPYLSNLCASSAMSTSFCCPHLSEEEVALEVWESVLLAAELSWWLLLFCIMPWGMVWMLK